MDIYPDDDEQAVAEAARRLVDRHGAMAEVRRAHASADGLIAPLWDAAAEQGWFLLAAPEAHGGLGAGLHQAVMVLEEAGRVLAPGPWVGTMLAAALLGDDPVAARARDGARIALGFRAPADGAAVRAQDGALKGRSGWLHDAVGAEALLVDVDGEVWAVAPPPLQLADALDPGLRLATVVLDGAVARPTGLSSAAARPVIDILVAGLAVGVAEGAFRAALTYAGQREQFGRPIGSFQAIKHRLAGMAAKVEQSRALVTLVAVRLSEGEDIAPEAAGAWRLAALNARTVAHEAVLVHGAMGYTSECDAHLYLKRSLTLGHFRISPDDALDIILGAQASKQEGVS